MRLLSATLRSYRLHRDLTVEFDRERTLIGGRNETGKSTLVEAIHRALFLKAKGTSEPHRAMESTVHGGKPEVELVFESAGTRYHLQKRFSGTTGTVTLTPVGGAPLSGGPAEDELARLCGVEAGANHRTCTDQHWAHLWIWQGAAGKDPSAYANLQKEALLQRLGEAGGAANLMRSALDSDVAAALTAARDAIFTQRGEAKAGSDLARAQEAAEAAQVALSVARARLDRLQQDLEDHASATAALVTLEGDLTTLTKQQGETERKIDRLEQLQRQEIAEKADAEAAERVVHDLRRAEDEIRAVRRRLPDATTALQPLTAEIERLNTAREAARRTADETQKAHHEAMQQLGRVRQEYDLAAAHVTLLEKRQQLDQLNARAQQVGAVRQRLTELRADVAKLPAINRNQVTRLRELEQTRANATSALEAMAAGIELVESDVPITVGDNPLAAGQPQVLTEDTELRIGQHVRIRIRPGGGRSLSEARCAAQDAGNQLRRLLDELGVKTSAEAQDIAGRRDALASQLEATSTRLSDLGADKLDQELGATREACGGLEADIARRVESLSTAPPAESDPARARAAAATAAQNRRDAEAAEQRSLATRNASATQSAASEEALAKARSAGEEKKRAVADLEARLQLLLEQHGADDARAQRLADAETRFKGASTTLAATRSTIAGLQPDVLAADRSRIARAIEQAQRNRQDTQTKRAIAENNVKTSGGLDPQADVNEAHARAQSAQGRLASLHRQAEAVRLLATMFETEQQELADRYTQPLIEKVSAYLQCLFGPGARLEMRLQDREFLPPALIRPAQGLGAAPFPTLSGGTKEQVAAALRLAMAEVLAANHDGCLPVVFDDAFAFADPDRVQILQRMLDLAATRGLQVIVITCTPSDYAALGAKTIILSKSAPAADPAAPSAPVMPALRALGERGVVAQAEPVTVNSRSIPSDPGSTPTPGDPPPTIIDLPAPTEEDQARFLAALADHGGKAGNTTLRTTLGWAEALYDTVKTALVAGGRVTRGRGRGGSVALTTGGEAVEHDQRPAGQPEHAE